jgi:hypothetical protein
VIIQVSKTNQVQEVKSMPPLPPTMQRKLDKVLYIHALTTISAMLKRGKKTDNAMM